MAEISTVAVVGAGTLNRQLARSAVERGELGRKTGRGFYDHSRQ